MRKKSQNSQRNEETNILDRFFGILVAFAIVFVNLGLVFADEEAVDIDLSDEAEQSLPEATDSNIENAQVERDIDPSPTEAEDFLDRLKSELNMTKAGYRSILQSIQEMKDRLETVQEEKVSLQSQLDILDTEILKSTNQLINVIKKVVQKENEIDLINEQIEIKTVAIEYQKELLRDYISLVYQEQNQYFDFDENGQLDAFKLLLADGTVGESLQNLEYFDLLSEAGQQMVDKLEDLNTDLETEKDELRRKRIKLQELQQELAAEKENLEFQKESKANLFSITSGQERIYEELLEQSIREQEEVLSDLKTLSESVYLVEDKIAELGIDFDPDEYLELLDYKTRALYDFHLDPVNFDFDGFSWPVDTALGVSAYFHDPGYVGVFGVQHNAIDIPVRQGSPVHAAADGVVYTAKDNGYGYSYIILAHADGFMTVYGHISNILVSEGTTVPAGSVIGMSGGMPGTKGAGYMTTGPHLHFEVMRNGMYVDPLDYLPLQVLTREQLDWLPEKYMDMREAELEDGAVLR